jgi:RND family efflux transporter MFP subunit
MRLSIPRPVVQLLTRLKQGRNRWRYGAAVGATLVGVLVLVAARHTRGSDRPGAEPVPLPTVAVARVVREDLYNVLTTPAELRPYLEVTLHAKVSGYLDQMDVDFGDHVKKDQVLAKLDAPDLEAQLENAMADERKTEAAYTNAHLIYTRLRAVNQEQPNLVSRQEVDTAEANDRTTFAGISAARADRKKFQTLVGYLTISAPFDGVITRRYADPGALIQAGTASDTQSMPLVRVSDNYRLRLDFFVSVDNVKYIHDGDPIEVSLDSLGGQTFSGTITRVTDRVEEDTRQMMAEIEVPNPDLKLVPGMYTTVTLKFDRRPQALAIPTQAVSAGQKSTVYVVNGKGEIEERAVKLGLETPDKWEVLSGLQEGDVVMVGSRSEVRPGQKVATKFTTLLAEE